MELPVKHSDVSNVVASLPGIRAECPPTYQDQHEPSSIVSKAGRVHNAQAAEDVTQCLPQTRHDDDPTVLVAMKGGLCNVQTGCQAEEYGEGD